MKICKQLSDSTLVQTHNHDSIVHVVSSDSTKPLKQAIRVDSGSAIRQVYVKKTWAPSESAFNVDISAKDPVDSTFLYSQHLSAEGINSQSINFVDSSLVTRFKLSVFSSRQDCYNFGPFSQNVFVEQKDERSILGPIKPLEQNGLHDGWFFFIIFSVVVGFASFKLFYGKFFALIVAGAFNSREAVRFYSSKMSQYPQIKIITYTILLAGIGLLAFNFLHLFDLNFTASISSLGYLIAVTAVYMFYRNIIGSMIRLISNEQEYFQLHDYNLFVYNFIITLIVIISVFLSIYLPLNEQVLPILIGISLSLIVLIFRTIRSFQLFIRYRFSIFYWILYFCALEVLPLAGLYFGFKRLVIIA
ncbi:MAG TPA: DUF4271 domain-containing protein [Williamwhitmania sp.]|nr:DUF4271 domain-containing protein [Williamwhitmania sp.]